MLMMLEDDPERLQRFRDVLRSIDPKLHLQLWRNAHQMMSEAASYLENTWLISLDPDLEEEPDGVEPGDRYMVAQWLVSQPIVRPVIVHSSNVERSTWMAGAFDLGKWKHWRVAPIGDDWIESDWRRAVTRLLKIYPPR
jgi:hypothetical protein